ncbi:beta-hexosaminidase 1 [Prunus dulcis]|uniref:Beta-hexosaminidase n=1 Tax=Prunus dulcis TaxID=3755 RepID=A0A4Y1R1F0_PRUDU|nr:beta-hexosaminidase 1 [Prunus dulcis]
MSTLFLILFVFSHSLCVLQTQGLNSADEVNDSLTYLWPLPSEFTFGNKTLSVHPQLSLVVGGNGGNSSILRLGFDRYKAIIFKNSHGVSSFDRIRGRRLSYDVTKLKVVVHSDSEDLQLGVDESYTLFVLKKDGQSIVGEATIEANTVYGALRAIRGMGGCLRELDCNLTSNKASEEEIETFSQLCTFDYGSKSVQVYRAPWYIRDSPRFAYRGLLLDTSRHYLPVDVIKQVIESMSYAKLNVLHWHVIDRESFPLEVPSYPKLWKGSYTKWERYTVEDAIEIVRGAGYPNLWPSTSCKEPLDVSKSSTFDVVSGILTDMRKIFPFELFHLGGDEVNTTCWSSTRHVKQWLEQHNMTTKDAYQYFVLKAQEIAISKNWTPVNWEETFNTFPTKLNPKTVVHNWLGSGVCPKAVAKGVWYLDHLDVPWEAAYNAEPLEGIDDVSQQKLVLGGEVCMWGETADTSDVQQTIWPRAAAAAERLWSRREATSARNGNLTALPRLQYFRCLLNRRGVQAAPVTNLIARSPPIWSGSCYDQ